MKSFEATGVFLVGEELEKMDAQHTVRMNPGEGETSYARNSIFQVRLGPNLRARGCTKL